MFRKLVSNLPFSPSLVNQLAFYSSRLRHEQLLRKLNLFIVVAVMLVQSVSWIFPAKATLASSPNDIVYGGGTKQELQYILKAGCDSQGRCDIRQIYQAYGINDTNLASARYENIYSSIANNYWSVGRAPRGYGGEIAKAIPGGPTIYARTLHGWAVNRSWPALRVETAQGTRWILTECGNIVTKETIEKEKVEPKNPDMLIEKSVNKRVVNRGEKLTFTLKIKNIGNGTAKKVLVYDDAPQGLDLLNDGLLADPIKSPRRWQTHKRFDVPPGSSVTYHLRARATAYGPVSLTNRACVDIFDVNIWNNCDDSTVRIREGCLIPGKEHLPKDSPKCTTNPKIKIKKTASKKELRVGDLLRYTLEVTNKGDVDLPKVVVRDKAPTELKYIAAKNPGKKNFIELPKKLQKDYISPHFALKKNQTIAIVLQAKVIQKSQDDVTNTACVLSVGDDTTAGSCDEQTIKIVETCPTNPSLRKDDRRCQPPCPYPGKENLTKNNPQCVPCDEQKQDENGADISCLTLHKTARNITQKIENANGTAAKPGDTIEYTLSVKNSSLIARKNFVMEENLEDVLEYAYLIDASGAEFSQKPVKMLTWQPVNIKPGQVIRRTILVKIKSPLPSTSASSSDPASFDLKMVNVYGNEVHITLPKQPIKTVEQTIARLPSTGMSINLILSTGLLMLVTYFYFRSRLLNKELRLVRQQFNASGAH